MIHISLDRNNAAVDLELEAHKDMTAEEFIKYISDWVEARPIASKKVGYIMVLKQHQICEFSTKVLNQPYFRTYVTEHYGDDNWYKIETILRCHEANGPKYCRTHNCNDCRESPSHGMQRVDEQIPNQVYSK